MMCGVAAQWKNILKKINFFVFCVIYQKYCLSLWRKIERDC